MHGYGIFIMDEQDVSLIKNINRYTIERHQNRFVCSCFTSLQQRGHLETAPPFTVPCKGHEAR